MDERTVLILVSIATVAATFAGFSGVVAVFGRRAHGEWLLEDRFRLVNMLVTSLGACLFALIPIVALLLHVDGPSLWEVSSLLMFVYGVAYIATLLPHWWHILSLHPGVLSPVASVVVLSSSTLTAGLQLLNAVSVVFHREAGPYVLGLVLYLVIAGLQFSLLVLRPLKAHRAHAHLGEAEQDPVFSKRD